MDRYRMQLFGRELEVGIQGAGAEVHLLQARLQLLGINILDEDGQSSYFGE